MATIVKRPEGTYRVQIRRKGQKTLSATFAKRSDAVDWGQKTEAAVIEKGYPRKAGHLMTSTSWRHGLMAFSRPGQGIDFR
jgi:hypothetical protein